MNALSEWMLKDSCCSLSVVGLSKNAGKTTVLNTLVREAGDRVRVGMFSIGVDGEELDAWSGREKPPVFVREGDWVATAATCLDADPGAWEVAEATGIHSTLGEVFLARALRSASVKLAGVSGKTEAWRVLRALRERTVFTLVDGAYDRRASSSPLLTDAVVLVIGASLHPTLDVVLKKAEEWQHLFSLPVCEEVALREALCLAEERKSPVGLRDGKAVVWSFSTLLNLEKQWEWLQEGWEGLAVPGALTDRMLDGLVRAGLALPLAVPDWTHVFAGLPALRRFAQAGGEVRVAHAARLVAVAVNPVSPDGYSFDPEEMKKRVARLFPTIPVWDVMRDCMGGRR
jgi:hypothetical protein